MSKHELGVYGKSTHYRRPRGLPIFGRRKSTTRMADEIETVMELWVCQHVFHRAQPLVEKLRRRTIHRRGYATLRAILMENSLLTGQPDETEHVLASVDRMWARCPGRYLPTPGNLKVLGRTLWRSLWESTW